jgi:hypothetical protein
MNFQYDCYQITHQVIINDEDKCMFNRYGPSMFNIKQIDSSSNKKKCNNICKNNNGTYIRKNRSISMPNAVILDVILDNCDCNKAIFIIYVRLPSANIINIDRFDIDTIISSVSILTGIKCLNTDNIMLNTTQNTNSLLQALLEDVKTYNNVNINKKIPYDVINVISTAILVIPDMVTNILDILKRSYSNTDCCDLDLFKNKIISVLDDLKFQFKNPNNKLTDVDILANIELIMYEITKLCTAVNTLNVDSIYKNDFSKKKFTICSGIKGFEKIVTTIMVNPLSNNIVATGVINECTKYDITRVPSRVFNTKSICGVEYALCLNSNDMLEITDECDDIICCPETSSLCYDPDVLHIVFPITDDLKCFIPSTNITKSCNSSLQVGNMVTEKNCIIVKITSNCPNKYCFPALLTFDTINCISRLEIKQSFINSFFKNNQLLKEYKQLFNANNKTNYSDIIRLPNFFTYLALSGRFDVVCMFKSNEKKNKCVEKIIYTFQICESPYRPFCVDSCGCSALTILPENITTSNSFKIQSDPCYLSYEFSKNYYL